VGANGYGQLLPAADPAAAELSGRTQDRLNAYFDTTKFTAPPQIGNGTGFGNAPRNFLRGPGQVNFDMALVKRFSLAAAHDLEFRSEFFNIFNTPQFGLPGNAASTPSTFGVVSTTVVSPRIVQLALRYRF